GVHFLRDDVGFFAYAARKQCGVLKDGGANLAEVVAGKDGARGCFDAVPERGLRRQKVACPADGFQCGHNLSSVNGDKRWTSLRNPSGDLAIVPSPPWIGV